MTYRCQAILFFILILEGCGYTLQHRLQDKFTDSRGIRVPVFLNTTPEVGAETVFTNALIRELKSHGNVIFGTEKGGALLLQGRISNINLTMTTESEPGLQGLAPYKRIPTEYAVTIQVSLTLIDPVNGKLLWSKGVAGSRPVDGPLDRTFNYQAPSAVGAITQGRAEAKYSEIAREMMREVYDEMVEFL